MDKLERELKRDAERIRADVTPELRARIDASLHAARIERRGARPGRPGGYLWWFSGLTGVAATLVAIILVGRGNDAQQPAAGDPPVAVVAMPETGGLDFNLQPLDVRNADFTEPLEDELAKLKSDLEKARDEVEREIRFSF